MKYHEMEGWELTKVTKDLHWLLDPLSQECQESKWVESESPLQSRENKLASGELT